MKTKIAGRQAALAEKTSSGDEALRVLLGRNYDPLAGVINWLRSGHPAVTVDERFGGQAGWHRIYLLKKRRLFYLAPKSGDFRFAMILGDRAIDRVRQGAAAGSFEGLLRDAKRYGEGTAFIFDARSFDPPLVTALLEAKLAH